MATPPELPKYKKEPDVKLYNPSPDYIRWVVRQKRISLAEAARRIGMPHSTFMDKLSPKLETKFSYSEQYTLESL